MGEKKNPRKGGNSFLVIFILIFGFASKGHILPKTLEKPFGRTISHTQISVRLQTMFSKLTRSDINGTRKQHWSHNSGPGTVLSSGNTTSFNHHNHLEEQVLLFTYSPRSPLIVWNLRSLWLAQIMWPVGIYIK